MPWSVIEPTQLIVPPELSARIQSECGRPVLKGLLPHRAAQPIFHRYNHEPAFCERVHAMARKLHDIIFSDSPEWGIWPTDLQEIIAVGFILGIYLEGAVDEMLLGLSEEELSFVEEQCREESLSLNELIIERLLESKQPGESWKGGEA
jgi:hypothetical protein